MYVCVCVCVFGVRVCEIRNSTLTNLISIHVKLFLILMKHFPIYFLFINRR